MKERESSANSRLSKLIDEYQVREPFGGYFREWGAYLLNPSYTPAMPEKYGTSALNPAFAVKTFGEEYGKLLSFLSYELMAAPAFKAEGLLLDSIIQKELFLDVYAAFLTAEIEGERLPLPEAVHAILCSYVSDYLRETLGRRIREEVDPASDFALRIIMDSDLLDLSYLDRFGEYVDDSIYRTAKHINSLPESDIELMAKVFTEGFRLGFINTGKDLSKKRTVNIRYILGFERVVRKAVQNFEAMGLKCTIFRRALHAANRKGMSRIGYEGAYVNKQMDFDHREDNALFLDRAFVDKYLSIMEETYEEVKGLAAVFAGPAVMETFGEDPFLPASCPEALMLSEEQRELSVELSTRAGELKNRYIKGEERSFTVISYPVCAIGPDFEAIFNETVKLNTLDYKKYEAIQSKLIEDLEKGSHVEVRGKNKNETRLSVALTPIVDREKETIFQNCLADVNIPMGEVFTTPVLSGTNGVLFVSEVYINGLRFENLRLVFKDGFVKEYSCTNFSEEAENLSYIRENILYNHETLPMGEFAIGTNTTAYNMARKYQIFSKLGILIAEKTGPHFAVGDTCYSRDEDIRVYNPDGREIIAKENECTLKRKTDPDYHYFECHTDITIPYEELDSIVAVDKEGRRYPIIEDGLFVVKGTEELNLPLA